jgi:hypothetical protein
MTSRIGVPSVEDMTLNTPSVISTSSVSREVGILGNEGKSRHDGYVTFCGSS